MLRMLDAPPPPHHQTPINSRRTSQQMNSLILKPRLLRLRVLIIFLKADLAIRRLAILWTAPSRPSYATLEFRNAFCAATAWRTSTSHARTPSWRRRIYLFHLKGLFDIAKSSVELSSSPPLTPRKRKRRSNSSPPPAKRTATSHLETIVISSDSPSTGV
jgi:hypothetical protein